MSGACFAAAAGSVGATGGGGGGPVSPSNSSGKLQVDGTTGTSHTFTAPWGNFTAGRDAVFKAVVFGARITALTIGGSAATLISRNTSDASNAPEVWLVQGMTGGTANIVMTVASGGYITGAVDEWAAGVLTGSAVDTGTANNAQAGSGSPSVSTAISTSQARTIIYGVAVALNSSAANGFTNPVGWTNGFIEQDAGSHEAGIGSWIEETSAGTKTFAPGMTSSAWAATIVALKLA